MATYRKNSPWADTPQNTLYLENLIYRDIPKGKDDAPYVIENQYNHRPDLLAHDLYGDSKLWWVFVVRNRSVLKDPIFDFVPGVTIFCPRKEDVLTAIQ
jgi:hypothetical protein